MSEGPELITTCASFLQACALTLGRLLWRATAWPERSASLCNGARRMTVSGGRNLVSCLQPKWSAIADCQAQDFKGLCCRCSELLAVVLQV